MELPIQVAQSTFFADGASRLYEGETRFSSFVGNLDVRVKLEGKQRGAVALIRILVARFPSLSRERAIFQTCSLV